MSLTREETRAVSLRDLMRPIKWRMTSTITSRRILVAGRHRDLLVVYPFLTEEEQARADIWFEKEAHRGLWED